MDRDAGQELWMLLGEPQHHIIRHKHRPKIRAQRAIGLVDALMGKKDNCIEGRFADELA